MNRHPLLLPLLSGALFILMVASLTLGSAQISFSSLPALLLADRQENMLAFIVWEMRLPRILLAVLIGAGLGMGGAVLQNLFHNPLAEPGILGISSAAALGAVAALFGGAWLLALSPPVMAVLMAFLAAGLLFLTAWRMPDPLSIILAGAAINALAVPLLALILTLSPNPWALSAITDWLLGSLKSTQPHYVFYTAPPIITGLALMLATARNLDRLSLGEETARALGMRPMQTYGLALAGCALATGASVAAAGAIGFAGLLAPHLVRPFCAYQPRLTLLPAALAGALLILAGDSLARVLPGPELHIGIFTALLGVPFFLFLLFRRAGREAL